MLHRWPVAHLMVECKYVSGHGLLSPVSTRSPSSRQSYHSAICIEVAAGDIANARTAGSDDAQSSQTGRSDDALPLFGL